MVQDSQKWDLRFLDLAEHVGAWSRDPSTKVGAVITDGKRVVSLGFNGFPQGVFDNEQRYNDREEKYKLIVHGEMNAIIFAGRHLKNCTLYTTPFPPCVRCAGMVIQAGIKRIVSWSNELSNPRWAADFKKAELMYLEADVQLTTFYKQPLLPEDFWGPLV